MKQVSHWGPTGIKSSAPQFVDSAVFGKATSRIVLLLAGWLAQRFDVRWVPGVGKSLAYPCNAKSLGQRMGVQNLCAKMAGMTAPLPTGFVLDATGSRLLALVIAAAVTASGVLAWRGVRQ